jgi:hypothetical protein
MKKYLLFIFFSIVSLVSLKSQEQQPANSKQLINLNSPFSYKMLEPNQNLRKADLFLTERKLGVLDAQNLIIGASLISLLDYQVSNTDSKFAYLMRHPTANNQIGKEVSEAVIHSFQVSFSGAVTSWLAAHAELLYSPEQSFGQGTITALGRNQIQLRTGFILIGDLNKFPLYAAIGKLDAPFGQTGSVSPFTNSTTWHAFGGLCYGLQVGFKKWDIAATFMAAQGGAQFRALNTPVGTATNIPSRINNFVADLNYTLYPYEKIKVVLGGSYLHGSAYCQPYPVVHFGPGEENNPAMTAYGNVTIADRIYLKGSFAKTLEAWPGTFNPNPPLDIYEASHVSSMDVGVRYNLNTSGNIRYAVSGEFSNFRAGADGAPWERQNQFLIGVTGQIQHASKLFIELFRTEGYVPLNFLSGGNLGPGETHSVHDARSHGIVIGGQITL